MGSILRYPQGSILRYPQLCQTIFVTLFMNYLKTTEYHKVSESHTFTACDRLDEKKLPDKGLESSTGK